tara:strand:- start:9800 stop:10510 length:711 start_codon:yes stop_codon:yes gene_type:complete
MNFQELLDRVGFGQYADYFDSAPKVAEAFGFTGDRAQQFGKFFQPFDRDRALEAFQEIGSRVGTRTSNLMSDVSSGLGGAISDILGTGAQTGFTRSGATQRLVSGARGTAEDALSRGRYQIDQQRGQEMAGLTGLFQNYLTGTFGRAERIDALDPTQPVSGSTPPLLDIKIPGTIDQPGDEPVQFRRARSMLFNYFSATNSFPSQEEYDRLIQGLGSRLLEDGSMTAERYLEETGG